MSAHPNDPRAVVNEFLEAFAAMDFDAALTHLADDAEYTNVPIGTVHGPTGVRDVLEPFFAPIFENEFVILRAFEVHDGKIAVWRDDFDLVTAAKIHAGDE